MEGRYTPGVIIALTDCTDVSKENEFNGWYNNTLIPGIETLGFIRNTRRYENVLNDTRTFQGVPKYLAIWEIYRDDLKECLKEIKECDDNLKKQGKGFNNYVKMIDTVYMKVGPEIRTERTGRPVTGVYVVPCYCIDPVREDEFNKWYNEKHAPETLALGLYDTAYRYKIVDQSEIIPNHVNYITIYETSMDPLEARKELIKNRPKWFSDKTWVDLISVTWTGAYRKIYPNKLAGK